MSTTIFEFGDVVLVPFPFTNQLVSKRRPAVVMSRVTFHQSNRDLILMPVTSQIRAPLLAGEMLVADWGGAGLLEPSVVKPVVMTLEKALVLRRLGRLAEIDRDALVSTLATILGE